MEQKQLDELEKSFTGEEFIDDDIIIEQVRPKAKPMQKFKPEIKEHKRAPEKIPDKKVDVIKNKASKEALSEKKVVEVKAAKAEGHKKVLPLKAVSKEEFKMEESIQPTPKAEPKIEVWHEESSDQKGLFKEAGTWKMITGVVLILLLLSVFTQGFSFAKGEGATGAVISQSDAEIQALAFVNDNLLQPPFVAQVKSTEEMSSLYKITFSIAGEDVDSYMTKDGALFFPQGFNPQKSLVEQLTTAGTSSETPEPEGEYIEEVTINGTSGEMTTQIVPVEEAETAPVESETEYTITAKKWLFTPNRFTVDLGASVTLHIIPQNMAPFTFKIEGLDVQQEISGPTTVEFTASKEGSFTFLCSSCEEFRGMMGTIVVE